MIRLFKHYVPNAVLLLGLLDIVLLVVSAELGWTIRAGQIGMLVEPMATRIPQLASFAVCLELAMVAVGVYGARCAAIAQVRDRAAAGRDLARHDLPQPDLLPVAATDLLAIEPAVRHGPVGGAPDRPAHPARQDARQPGVQAPHRRARRRRAGGAVEDACRSARRRVRRRRLCLDERGQPRHSRGDRARCDLQSRRSRRPAQRERGGAGAGGAAQRAAAEGSAADQDHRRPRQRDFDLPRTRNRPRRSRQRQSVVADLLRRIFLQPRALQHVQAAVRHRRQHGAADRHPAAGQS